jgi:hypothetical protein
MPTNNYSKYQTALGLRIMVDQSNPAIFTIYAEELNALQILGAAHGAKIRQTRQQEIVDAVRNRISESNPCADMILKLVKEHLDGVISGELPMGCGGNISAYCAIRAYIDNMEKYPWICEKR